MLFNPIYIIFQKLVQLVPFFRYIWASTIVLGVTMLVIALLLKRNPTLKKSPWIVGIIGLVVIVSSGSQLIFSFL